MNLIYFILPLFIGLTAFAQTSYIPASKILSKGGYELSLGGDYFRTTKNVDKDGVATSLPSGSSFNRMQGEFGGYYGATNELQFGVGLRWRRNSSTSLDATGNNNTLSSSGVQSTFFNMKYAFRPVGKLQYTLEGLFRYTPYTNKESTSLPSTDELILGDDGSEYSGGLSVTYAYQEKAYLTARGGLRSPGIDLSSEVYWQFEGAYDWKKFALIAGVDGVTSTGQDPHNGSVADHPRFNTGATALYNSINRQWVAPYAGFNIGLGKTWRVELKGSQVVNGRSTDMGSSFAINLVHRVDKDKTKVKDTKFKTYDIEVTIVKVSPKKGYVSIDGGLSRGLQKGMKIDFFEFDYLGGNVLVASGTIIQSKADTGIVKITHTYNSKIELKEGLVGRTTIE